MSDQPQTPEILDAAPPPPPGPTSFGARLRGYFLAGLLVTAPVAITFYLAWIFINFLDRQVGLVLPNSYNPATYLPFGGPGLGLLITTLALILIGALTTNYVGRYVHRTGERVLARLPVVRNIYSATKQIFETVFSSQSNAFREAVVFEYPRRGIWTVGFITGKTQGEIQAVSEDKLVNVFVPTTPNPTSGFLLFVPKKELIPLSMTVEEAIKMVISGGLVTPPDRRPPALRVKPIAAQIPTQTADI